MEMVVGGPQSDGMTMVKASRYFVTAAFWQVSRPNARSSMSQLIIANRSILSSTREAWAGYSW